MAQARQELWTMELCAVTQALQATSLEIIYMCTPTKLLPQGLRLIIGLRMHLIATTLLSK